MVADAADHLEETLKLKAKVMEMLTVYLKVLGDGANLSSKGLQICLDLSLQAIMIGEEDKSEQGMIEFKTEALMFFCNVMVCHTMDVLAYIRSKNISQASLLLNYKVSLPFLNRPDMRRLTALATLHLMAAAEAAAVCPVYEELLNIVTPEVFQFVDGQPSSGSRMLASLPKQDPLGTRRRTEKLFSPRRDEISKLDPKFLGMNLLDIFKKALKTFEDNCKSQGVVPPAFEREYLQDNIMRLLQTS